MSSFLVLREGDTRNRWRDGQVCPDVGQGIMAPWARRPGCVLERKRDEREREKPGLGWRTGKSPALDGGSMRVEPWLKRTGRERERKGLSPRLEWKDDERRWLNRSLASKNIPVAPQPPYSPDLSPCDFFLFPKLKNHLKGHPFETLENIQTAVNDQLKAIPISEFPQYYEEWKKRLQRCVAS
ncbi:putative transposase [Trichonephila clavipes]|nr:putative transposase [Trichonephila clavipes]